GGVLLFGGFDGGRLGDTWLWDGTDWTELSPDERPSPRSGAGLAYYPATGRLMLFGGIDEGSPERKDDTWIWDGGVWSLQSPETEPKARSNVSMAFDPQAGGILMFGGQASGMVNETWLYALEVDPPTAVIA